MAKDYAAFHRVSVEEAKDRLMQSTGQNSDDMILPVTFRPAIELAIHSHDQLRTIAGLGGAAHLSFDQTAVEATARMHGIQLQPRDARDLSILQAEALKIMRDDP